MEHLNQLFIEAGTLMLTGMVFVFAFLGLLIIFINTVLTRLAIKYPDAASQSSSRRFANKATKVPGVSPNTVAAISGAVNQYRQQHTKKK